MTTLTTALTGYMPIPRCCDRISRVAGEATNGRTLTTYETVSTGPDSGSTSDKHRASNPTTISTLVILRLFIPFVTELWISVSCLAVNLNATNSSLPLGSFPWRWGRQVVATVDWSGGLQWLRELDRLWFVSRRRTNRSKTLV